MNIRARVCAAFLVALLLVGCVSTVSKTAQNAAVIQAGLSAASQAKVSVAEKYASTGAWADSNAAAGYDAPVSGPAVVRIGARGVVTVSYPQLVGGEIVLTPHERENGQIDWVCASHGLASSSLPEGCT